MSASTCPGFLPGSSFGCFGDAGCGDNGQFPTPSAQASYIRTQLPQPACPCLRIEFYPARYWDALGSILPSSRLPKRLRPCDWLILEEPEHLNWAQPWSRYRERAARITGIVLTNYRYYGAHALPRLPQVAAWLEGYNRWLIEHRCDDVILLNDILPGLPKAQHLMIGGIHPAFFDHAGQTDSCQGLYFMGKLIWEKGFRELIDLLAGAVDSSVDHSADPSIDVFGIGRDRAAIADYARARGVQLNFRGLSTAPAEAIAGYRVFINASKSEMHCTTTAEALGQRKFVILPRDPSNELFYPFRNALPYSSPEEFKACLRHALSHQPVADPLEASLSWDAAIDRLLDYYEGDQVRSKRDHLG
jgi:digalactosyldiacylglycerol synthase